ncbi:Retrovirus-related Pol polyprotein from transposon TNT 1-94 [Dendrobium catenatum]|uniref:Retrovirus-related Pol polyprotein from transposon TNT 1-94 n=1 Tax=Dendrobium catenatum TaxID=906689 RepID=A0A2I0VS12_9ASPA|nr:Retrovirus-related Pol polyprotein from transposon TNT 1-94 [Dendrobium catenatum]
MANSAPASSSSMADTNAARSSIPAISHSLKFVISNLKFLVPHSLTPDNFPIWSTQIAKLFKANGFGTFLDPNLGTENQDPNQDPSSWTVTDQNLATAMCSTISPEVLPYVIHLESTNEIWKTLHTRFQSSNRSKVIQLKNELHNISMQSRTMTQYLTEVKKIVDQISSAGSSVDPEDVIIYILNGLPPAYQPFTTTIRTLQSSMTLDNLYSLLMSEEIHIKSAAQKFPLAQETQSALFSYRGRGRRGRTRSNNNANPAAKAPQSMSVQCQICKKKGHEADTCWHRLNANYVPNQQQSKSTNALIASNDVSSGVDWYIDSGASSHMTNSTDHLTTYNPYYGNDTVTIGDGRSVPIAHTGSGILPTPASKLLLSQLLHIPSLSYNLLSISNLVKDNNISITFDANGFVFKDPKTDQIILSGPCHKGLYKINSAKSQVNPAALSATTFSVDWHKRLGHPHRRILQQISRHHPSIHLSPNVSTCTSCLSCKGHKLPFERSSSSTNFPLELVHSDVWGPSPVPSHLGYNYYVIFVDDFSRFVWLFPLQSKHEVTDIFINFTHFIERQTNRKLKIIRTDGGGEFVNHKFQNFTRTAGILHQTSCPYTPEQNGLAERKHRHIITMTRILLHTAGLPMSFWMEAALTATYLINRTPSLTIKNISPIQRMFNIVPSYEHLRVFGCECYPLSTPIHRTKLSPTSDACIFLGYSDTMKGYKCLNLVTNKVLISRNVQFNEVVFPYKNRNQSIPTVSSNTPPNLLIPISTIRTSAQRKQPSVSNTKTIPSPHSTTAASVDHITTDQLNPTPSHQHKSRHMMTTRAKTGSLKPVQRLNLIHHQQSPCEPTTYREASKFSEWRNAMAEEFYALQKQGTWELVSPPPNSSILGSKWTYRIKRKSDGSIARFKARLVAQGNQQQYGLDYLDTFSPVAKLPTVRILLAVAIFHKWNVHQLDVSNAFLHGDIKETVYMRQPKGFEDSIHPTHVCKLRKAIYGLRQAPRQWYTTFTEYLLRIGFIHSQADPSLLLMHKEHLQIYLLVYVDDILITGNDIHAMQDIIEQLKLKFTMKDLGLANQFLGIHIDSLTDKFFLSQNSYANSIVQMAELHNCNSVSNPSFTKPPAPVLDDHAWMDAHRYRQIIGSLQYLTLTRPDISYAVNALSQHMHDPSNQHMLMLKKLLRYIKGTTDFGLPISRSDLTLRTFSDADWASDPVSRKSTSGFCTFLGKTLISWTVKKQQTVSRSSTESEYRALASATADTIWIKRLLEDFRIHHHHPVDVFCDNTSTIALANNPVFHARTKHIEIDQRFIRDHIQNNTIRLLPISTKDQIADILTKPLSTSRFKDLRSKLTIFSRSSVCGGLLEACN